MRYMLRSWETLGRSERIVAMSLAVGGTVAVTNSTVWAIAVCYMARQKTRVALAAAQSVAIRARVPAAPARSVASGDATDSVSPETGVAYTGS